MVMPARALLNSGGWGTLLQNRALKCFLVFDYLRGPATPEPVAALLRQSSAVDSVSRASGATLTTYGSSFFWYVVDILYDRLERQELCEPALWTSFASHLFDSFFPVLADADCVVLAEPDTIALPTLEIRVPDCGPTCRLVRISATTVAMQSNGRTVHLSVPASDDAYRLKAVPIPPRTKLLLQLDGMLDDPMAKAAMATLDAPEAAELGDQLNRSLAIVRHADMALAERIEETVLWCVPIQTPDKKCVHNSFTISRLHGAVFLSEAYYFLHLTEALVHEYYHNELWLAMAVEKHLQGEDTPRLYSPWRQDCRPPSGLYHGIYVFTGLLEFFAAGQRGVALREHHEHFQAREYAIYFQVRTALAQVPDDVLTSAGREVVKGLREITAAHGARLGISEAPISESQLSHWRDWCDRYPDLVGKATPPFGAWRPDTGA